FWAFGLPLQAVFYPSLICLAAAGFAALIKAVRQKKKHDLLKWLKGLPDNLPEYLEDCNTPEDQDYRALIETLYRQKVQDQAEYESRLQESRDYYAAWVHQVKIPIAAMKLRLDQQDSADSRALNSELFRVEQYLEMVLAYERLGSSSTDYRFQEVSLLDCVKRTLHEFAGPFISAKIRMKITPPKDPSWGTALTDEKWFGFVLSQIFSNALKYAAGQSVEICFEGPGVLVIRDTGIGIAPEDLPRIFEKGFTGVNGRSMNRSSGLGLYLAKKICDNLKIDIAVSSRVKEGTEIRLALPLRKTVLD
ncbi:MAG: sensor histidine kinase, partial [Erysipelotrichaceae bacterium]|nr:sensor histidine kinase [Erysipelotrichaceae bacterium]